MTFKGYKIHVILITFVIIVAVGFGAQKLVYGRHVTESLERDFTSLSGVDAVEVRETTDGTDIYLHVDDSVDFPSVYREAKRLATKRFGEPQAKVFIEDDRTDALQAAYEGVHLALYEGAATGRFVQMDRNVRAGLSPDTNTDDTTMAGKSFDYKLSVDEDAVYFELSDGERVLYERIPRQDGSEGKMGGMFP